MDSESKKAGLRQALDELGALLDERDLIDVRVAKKRKEIAAWTLLVGEEEGMSEEAQHVLDRESMKNAIGTVLRAATTGWMTSSAIQAALREYGFDLARYQTPHSAIQTTLTRMYERGEIEMQTSTTPGGAGYKWVGSRFSEAAQAKYGATNSLANMLAEGRLPNGRATGPRAKRLAEVVVKGGKKDY